MKINILKIALFLFGWLVFHTATAQEMQSGLLLVSTQKSKLIPLGKKVKIWAGEDNKVYRAKMLAVDNDFVYLSTGQRLPIKSINSIKRKRIMFRDIGEASVVTGIATSKVAVDWSLNAMFPEPSSDAFGNLNNDNDASFKNGFVVIVGGVIVAIIATIGVGIVTATAGVFVGIFEPRYYAGKWEMLPYNPSTDVMFVNTK